MSDIQAGNTTFRGRSDIEMAQVIADNKDWRFVGDQVADTSGRVVSTTIEELAHKAKSLGWFNDKGVQWTNVPHDGVAAADAIRAAR